MGGAAVISGFYVFPNYIRLGIFGMIEMLDF